MHGASYDIYGVFVRDNIIYMFFFFLMKFPVCTYRIYSNRMDRKPYRIYRRRMHLYLAWQKAGLKEAESMLLVTTENISGKNLEMLGLVKGSTIQTVNAFKDMCLSQKGGL